RNLPQRVENYALLRRPQPWKLDHHDVDAIFENMKARIRDGFEISYGPSPMSLIRKPGIRRKITDAVRALEKQDRQREEAMLNQLGVGVIWYEDHAQIDDVAQQILGRARKAD